MAYPFLICILPYIINYHIKMYSVKGLFFFIFISTMTQAQINPAFFYGSNINRQDAVQYPVYEGNDLGTRWSPGQTTIKIWAPTMQQVKLVQYDAGTGGTRLGEYDMKKSGKGVWSLTLTGNQAGTFFTIAVFNGREWSEETTDPYSRAVGVNGKRTAIIDPATTHPSGWATDKSPGNFSKKSDAIIYELHVRDATIDPQSGIPEALRGRFAGLSITDSKHPSGFTTGLAHIRELGVTHIQLLPIYDFYTVDESRPDLPQYNWGYDPLHYNVPEGSYSTNAADPATRIRELKALIQTCHQQGLRVVMDVVYNHTMLGDKSNFNIIVPGYYYRTQPDGQFSNGSGCGNETASDAPMFRKFMLESLQYWVKEFHIDGFRFDLMALHDQATMNLISKTLHQLKPDILLHGEGWTGGGTPLDEQSRAIKRLAYKLDRIGIFSDDLRDAIKGGWSSERDSGFISGRQGTEESIKCGIVGGIQHPDIDYNRVNYAKSPFTLEPWQCIAYNECHDNHTLWDRLANSSPHETEEDRKKMYKLAQMIVLTSQGIPFIHAGQEMYRTKQGVDNSYNKPDAINQIYWDWKKAHGEMVDFTTALIKIRRTHSVFRLSDAQAVAQRLRFLPVQQPGLVAYTLRDKGKEQYFVALNGSKQQVKLDLPPGSWQVLMDGAVPGKGNGSFNNQYLIKPISGLIMMRVK